MNVIERAKQEAPRLSDRELADAMEAEPLPMFARWQYLHEAARRLRASADLHIAARRLQDSLDNRAGTH